jgi:hypothetical protein
LKVNNENSGIRTKMSWIRSTDWLGFYSLIEEHLELKSETLFVFFWEKKQNGFFILEEGDFLLSYLLTIHKTKLFLNRYRKRVLSQIDNF